MRCGAACASALPARPPSATAAAPVARNWRRLSAVEWSSFRQQLQVGRNRRADDMLSPAGVNVQYQIRSLLLRIVGSLRRARLRRARECRRDVAHEAIHLLLHLRVRLEADVEVEDHLVEPCGLDL